jgi:hypothetical protein
MEVRYERDAAFGNGYQAYRGTIHARDNAVTVSFEHYDFANMLRCMSKYLDAGESVSFIRIDRQDIAPYVLDDALSILVRDNVEAAIEQMSQPDIRIVVGRPEAPPAVVSACDGTLSKAFGSRLHIRRREDKGTELVECPFCGSWAPTCDGYLKCKKGHTCRFGGLSSQYVSVLGEDLLASTEDRFFLPREWNSKRPWISRETLTEMHKEFLAQKEKFDDRK